MNELRDFLNWFDGFAENIEKTPTPKQWAKIKERVAALREPMLVTVEMVKGAPAKPVTPAPKPEPSYPFIIDRLGTARNGKTKAAILPADVTDVLYDLRGVDGDMKTIIWADGSQGLNGRDLTIVAV